MADATKRETGLLKSSPVNVSKGLITIGSATVLLLIISGIFAPSSISPTSLSAMLPVASVLAIAGLGQMLVVQQGGIDLSVAGAMSLAVVIVTHVPDGNSGMLGPAVLLAIAFAIAAGIVNGLMIGGLGLNPIIATLGTNALLYGLNLAISGGRPRITTTLLASIGGGSTAGMPNAVFFALAALLLVAVFVKRTVAGRRFEVIGDNPRAARAMGLRVKLHQTSAYIWAQLLYCGAGILIAGITSQPIAYAGDTYLLPSVAVVVLGGTSLLGGRGFAIPTVIAAIFLQQLNQFVFSLGVSSAIQIIIQAAALAVGVSLYTVNWAAIWTALTRRTRAVTP
ncbi:ABC transporter permease [Galbitalea soli]|uniref:ABC transporter permease n=1 Tax=Galbitalea soli TaxID=1268042 RepID=A0A7C9TRC5_9MICO|nr:ABC transporter permease [Galbitalea soli]NEM91815.1 ABC transporter permease [Galbitalea soli]NYJ29352.1 ribose transport system permease protein [Galbitalea soli]